MIGRCALLARRSRDCAPVCIRRSMKWEMPPHDDQESGAEGDVAVRMPFNRRGKCAARRHPDINVSLPRLPGVEALSTRMSLAPIRSGPDDRAVTPPREDVCMVFLTARAALADAMPQGFEPARPPERRPPSPILHGSLSSRPAPERQPPCQARTHTTQDETASFQPAFTSKPIHDPQGFTTLSAGGPGIFCANPHPAG